MNQLLRFLMDHWPRFPLGERVLPRGLAFLIGGKYRPRRSTVLKTAVSRLATPTEAAANALGKLGVSLDDFSNLTSSYPGGIVLQSLRWITDGWRRSGCGWWEFVEPASKKHGNWEVKLIMLCRGGLIQLERVEVQPLPPESPITPKQRERIRDAMEYLYHGGPINDYFIEPA